MSAGLGPLSNRACYSEARWMASKTLLTVKVPSHHQCVIFARGNVTINKTPTSQGCLLSTDNNSSSSNTNIPRRHC
ncbi:hypothetical protein IV203_028564 [Nitzschia inconspicua]|uniref:Uncharacterized protein n=1 Tax=Nitzschia inconspicua TaxID=303405 RepID=A0A9K3Q2C7_9STRA|nr:hypothetical protein IV203_028564 [Nitzschia inconspicua]